VLLLISDPADFPIMLAAVNWKYLTVPDSVIGELN